MDDLIDRIHEAAFVPSLWSDVLQRLSDVSNSAAGSVLVFDDGVRYIETDLIRPVMDDITVTDDWARFNLLEMMHRLRPPAAFIYDADLFPPDVLVANKIRIDRVRSLGIGGEVGTFEVMPTGELLVIAIERSLTNDRPSDADLAALNYFRPHLMRAGLIGARLRLERATTMTGMLQSLGIPGAMLTAGGRVVAVNSLLEELPHVFRSAAFERLSIVNEAADRLLDEALEAERSSRALAVRSIPAPAATPHDAPYVVHLLPGRRSARDLFAFSDVLLAATKIDAKASHFPHATLIGLFDLSPTEAKFAAALAGGMSIAGVASANNVTLSTARTYLQRIFAKTGTRRQSDLVALIRSIAAIGSFPTGA